jgi:maltose O-acetyltransferase
MHALSLLPSLSGSLALRRGFMTGSKIDRRANGTFFPGFFLTYPKNIELGERVFINRNVFINALAPIRIGDRVLIGPNVVINSGNHTFARTDVSIQEQPHELKPIEIGDDVWIGANVVVTAGVTIGSHAVIGAGAVVTRSIPAFGIAVGAPAKVIRSRDHGS